MSTTRVVVNVSTHETRTYEFDGDLTNEEAVDEIETGEYAPLDSKVHAEDVDVIELEHLDR